MLGIIRRLKALFVTSNLDMDALGDEKRFHASGGLVYKYRSLLISNKQDPTSLSDPKIVKQGFLMYR